MKIGILAPPNTKLVHKWIVACEVLGCDYLVFETASSNWLNSILDSSCSFFLTRPPGNLVHEKIMYDEKIYVLSKVLGYRIYPSYEECYIYENKKLLSYFLKATRIPHPETDVFYLKNEALDYIDLVEFPIVGKTSIGASGTGVRILKTRASAKKYVNQAFSKTGIKREFGPSKATGSPSKWLSKAILNPSLFVSKLRQYIVIHQHGERDYLLFQKYIPHTFEWRVVKIGDSFFAHKKAIFNLKASGSKVIDYVKPPLGLLDFARNICFQHRFNFMAIDILEDSNGDYLVNELQTLFGHVQDYIMSLNSIPGRYRFISNSWQFEPGNFNSNESYNLRLKAIIDIESELEIT